jgi:dTDP-4-amino-4,6-dideoxygalactose transaminase
MITKSASNTKAYTNDLLFTNNARGAWEHLLSSIKQENIPLNILMPSYIGHTDREGSGVFDPLVAQKANAEFYKLKGDLTIEMEHFEQLIASKRFSVALIIHYFGFCRNDMERIKKTCQHYEVILVEDCAHAFQLHEIASSLGKYGDFSFYSLHKYLPTKSGGILKANKNGLSVSPLPVGKKIDFEDLAYYTNADFKAIAEKRRANYTLFEQLLSENTELDILYKLEERDIPQTFALRVKNGLREKLYFYLIERDAPTTALYYRMIKEISSELFPVSHQIANEILNLPVHQDTEKDDIYLLCSLIEDFYEKNVS